MSLGSVTLNLSALTTSNNNLIRSDATAFSATYTSEYEADIAVTATPTAFTINGYIGASPVAIFIYNPNTVAATVLGVASFTQTLPAGQFLFMPYFVTTSQLTLSLASGTGSLYVKLLK